MTKLYIYRPLVGLVSFDINGIVDINKKISLKLRHIFFNYSSSSVSH